ncbi:MAG: Succinyl-CoA ligase (ADP-forming) subunit alpha [Methanoregula sp. PtaU1.Bin051]|nr:MAG: Succinyl-CoA ligase (ADP-forming) subunit alpha [Methanoregula sp. PtaU1.Bin051]
MADRLASEAEGYRLMTKYGIPVPKYAIARTMEEAEAAADTIGYPVVMKVISAQIVHKSDAGGVVLSITDKTGARKAFAAIMTAAKNHSPAATVDGVIVEQQMGKGLELIIGGRTDPAFGKVITVGLGGTLVELLRDVGTRVLPADTDEIRYMIHELRGYPLIRGFRNEPARDEEEVVRIVAAAARMFVEEVTVTEFDINPLIVYGKGCCAVDARFYVGDTRKPARRRERTEMDEKLLAIRSIAVVGASPDPGKVGYAVVRNLLGFPGNLYPVNPKHGMILGRKAYPSLAALPESVDAAVIAVPARSVARIVAEAGERKIPLVIILSSGFREAGDEGRKMEEELVAIARQTGTRIMGPNCLGLMIPEKGINTTFDPVSARTGTIAFISQSGAIITTIVDWSLPEGIGFSSVISVGNQADMTIEDFARYAGSDPSTRAIILYIEQILDGRRFLDIMREVTVKKPVVAVKAGSSAKGQKAAATHTGSLAGSHEVYMAAFRQAGVIAVDSIRDAFQTAELLASENYPKGIRAVVISNAGGFAVLSSDYAERYCIDLIEFSPALLAELDAVMPANWSRANPIDMVGDSGPDRYARTFDVMIRNQNLWDIAFVIAVPSAISDPIRVANELVRFSKNTRKMIVGCLIGGDSMKTPMRILRDASIPNFPELEDAFRAVGAICRHRCGPDIHECFGTSGK